MSVNKGECRGNPVWFAFAGPLLVLMLLLASCRYGFEQMLYRADSVNSRAQKITDMVAPEKPAGGKISVLILADIHFGADAHRPDIPEQAFFSFVDAAIAEGNKPDFAIVLGDMTDAGREGEYADYLAFVDKLERRDIIVYSIVGNHDLYNSGWTHWRYLVYPHTSYYRLKTAKFSWYFLDPGNGSLGQRQLANFIAEAENDGSPKLVFTHYPVYAGGAFYFSLADPHERALLLDTFARTNVKLLLNGHYHWYRAYDYGKFREISVAAFRDGGKWYMLTVDEDTETVELR
jgi:3',5'-cyclic AMP phosphodiesterase CpdA